MYQSIYYDRKSYTYFLRDDEKGWLDFKYIPELYRINPNGEFPTLDGKYANAIKKYDWNDFSLYEKDIDQCTRVLIDLYKDSDDAPKNHNIACIDIECVIGGTLTPEYIKAAPMKITSISLYDAKLKMYTCLILDEEKKLEYKETVNERIIPCLDEKELILKFLDIWEEIDPTIITGWNSGFFDIPYLYYRILNILGEEYAIRLSPIRKINITEWNKTSPVEIGGINHLDYMLLVKKFFPKQEPSYKLNDIGEKYLNLNKIEYDGSLDKLFKDDLNKFIRYNLRDVEIIILLEDKFKFIDLTINICHLCHTPYERIYLSTVLNDGAILTYLKRRGIVSPNKPTTINPLLKDTNNDDYAGGYLKDPVPGLYEWIIDLDFTSLYPSIIRSLNIGIETLVGRIINDGKYDDHWTYSELLKMDPNEYISIEKLNENFTTSKTQVKIGKIIKLIEDNNWIVAASGAIFRTDKSSVVCEVLSDWFNKRTQYKKLMKEAYKKGDKIKGEFYNRLQHAYKIKLNDVYGCYAINGWRYTDGHKMISSAITLTGQRLDQEAIIFVNKWINKKLKTKDIDYVITADTDSLFIHVKDLLIQKGIDIHNKEECIKCILELANEIQTASNKFISEFATKAFNLKNREHHFELKQEVVLERGYFAGKRRYAMLIVNKEGVAVEQMEMVGLDLMKSNMPPLYKKFGKELLTEIMVGKPKSEIDKKIVNFRSSLESLPWGELAKPTGVKQIKSYIAKRPSPGEIFSEFRSKAPINTKAAIIYNDLIKFKKLEKKYNLFTEGDKMKYVNLKPNPYNIEVIGLNGYDDPEFIIEFIDKYVDRETAFNSVLLNKLTGVYDDIGWGKDFPVLNAKINKFFKF